MDEIVERLGIDIFNEQFADSPKLVDLLEAQDGLYIGAEAPVDPALRLRSQPIQAQLL